MPNSERKRSKLNRTGWVVAGLSVGAASVAAALVATFALAPPAPDPEGAAAQDSCPAPLTETATCTTAEDSSGAFYTIAMPDEWNGSLVVYAHGGPSPSLDAESTIEDLEEWAVMVDQGFAWVGSSYHRGGFGVRSAAGDVERSRELFTEQFGQPDRTYLHGQSWGGNVAAKTAESYPAAYDGLLLTNGNIAGATRGYDHRVDLRAVAQYYCNNLPLNTEEPYPVWQGLPRDSALTPEDVSARLAECVGTENARTAVQQRNLDDILGVTGIPEQALETHFLYATFLFQDIVTRLDGRNPFSNDDVVYAGSHDDAALNAGVERFTADPSAVRDLSYDSDLTGEIEIPVLTLHAIHDPSVFVEHESAFYATMEAAGNADRLIQTFTTESKHNELSAAQYAASILALDSWVRSGTPARPSDIAESCARLDERYESGCFYDLEFKPGTLAERLNRPGLNTWPALSSSDEDAWSLLPDVGINP